jgi:hypothetical protein
LLQRAGLRKNSAPRIRSFHNLKMLNSKLYPTNQLIYSLTSCRLVQAEKLRGALATLTLRRLRADCGPPAPALLEVTLPVELAPPQAACYRSVLTRFYELLSDPKPPRHSGHRCSCREGLGFGADGGWVYAAWQQGWFGPGVLCLRPPQLRPGSASCMPV